MIGVVRQLRDVVAAAMVLQRRGLVDLSSPVEAVRASRALRKYGSFGGLITHAAARYGDVTALVDEAGTMSFRDLDRASNALARGLSRKGIKSGTVIGILRAESSGPDAGVGGGGQDRDQGSAAQHRLRSPAAG